MLIADKNQKYFVKFIIHFPDFVSLTFIKGKVPSCIFFTVLYIQPNFSIQNI